MSHTTDPHASLPSSTGTSPGTQGSGRDLDGCRAEVELGPPSPGPGARRALGRAGEQVAAEHLRAQHGLRIIGQNVRIAVEDLRGELDLIASDPRRRLLIVCEVKTRTYAREQRPSVRSPVARSPAEGARATLGSAQQRRIRRLTGVLLAGAGPGWSAVRFDLVAIDVLRGGKGVLEHLEAAW